VKVERQAQSARQQPVDHGTAKVEGALPATVQSDSVQPSPSKNFKIGHRVQGFPDVRARPRLRVLAGSTIALGPGKAELLERLHTSGSITKAAQEMKMSYMRAWTLIRTMNRCFKHPVVVSTQGGRRGGGAQLTETGQEVLALYKKMDAECLRAIGPLQKKLGKYL
jgi:molybdate transport system regulatory protein